MSLGDGDAVLQQRTYIEIMSIRYHNDKIETFQILDWISPPGHQPTDVLASTYSLTQTLPDRFVTSDPTYHQWIQDAELSNWHLNCFAKPGAGKSHRARAVIGDLSTRMRPDGVPVLFVLFSQGNESQQSLRAVYCRLLRQLISRRVTKDVPDTIRDIWDRGRLQGQAGPSEAQARDALVTELKNAPRKFIVTDALDEAVGCSSSIHSALSTLRRDAKASIFSTTRLDPTEKHDLTIVCSSCNQETNHLYWMCGLCKSGLSARFDLCKECFRDKGKRCNDRSHAMHIPEKLQIEVQPTPQEIKAFVADYLKDELSKDDTDGVDNGKYRGYAPIPAAIRKAFGHEWDSIAERISLVARDSYLIAVLILKRLIAQKNVEGAKKVLGDLVSCTSHSYDDQYNDMLNLCLNHKGREGRKVAKDHLALVSCAQESLSFKQLCHAVAVQPGDKTLEDLHDRRCSQQTVRKETNGLLLIGNFGNPECETVWFFHRTLADYLEEHSHDWFPDREQMMFDACYAYLQLDVFEKPFERPKDIDGVLEDYPFASYAARFWGEHLRKVSQPKAHNVSRVLELLNDPGRKLAAQQLALHVLSDQGRRAADGQTTLHARANRDLTWDVQENTSALHVCAFHGLTEICSILIADGETVDCLEESYGQTALHFACRNGHLDVIRILLDSGANPNVVSDRQHTPLMEAIAADRLDVVGLFLNNPTVDVNASAEGVGKSTALTFAVEQGRCRLVKRLLKHDKVQVNKRDAFGRTALACAVRYPSLECVNMLLQHPHIDLSIEDDRVGTPLDSIADMSAKHFQGDDQLIAEAFLRRTDTPRLNGKSLQYFIEDGRHHLVRLFLEKQAYFDWKDEHGRSLVHIAATCSGDVQTLALVYGVFFKRGFDINSCDSYGSTPLHAAYSRFETDNGATAEYLLKQQPKPNIMQENLEGLTPIDVAYQNVPEALHGTVNQMFVPHLAQGMDLGIKNSSIPIERIVAAGILSRLETAIQLEPTPLVSTPDPYTGWTALHWTIYSRRGPKPSMMRLLLPKAQPYLNARSHAGRTCLHAAAMRGCSSAVELLIQAGAERDDADQFGDTPIDLAQRCSDLRSAYLLIKAGAKIRKETTKKDLIHYAIAAGEDDVVKTLVDIGVDIYQRKDDTGLTALSLAKELYRKAMAEAKNDLVTSNRWQTFTDDAAFESAARDEPKPKVQRRILETIQRARRSKSKRHCLHRDLSGLIQRVKEQERAGENGSITDLLLPSKLPHEELYASHQGLLGLVQSRYRSGFANRLLGWVRVGDDHIRLAGYFDKLVMVLMSGLMAIAWIWCTKQMSGSTRVQTEL